MESWKKTLLISAGVIFFQSAGLSMMMPFLPLYLKDLGVTNPQAQATWSGLLSFVSFFFVALLAPVWGTLSDKYGRKPLILRATFGISLIAFLMSLVTNVYQLLVLRILHGFCGGVMPTFIALVAHHLPRERTGQGLGGMQVSLLAGNIVGPFIGGLLSDWVGYRNVLLVISGLTLTASVLTMLFIHEERRDPATASFTIMDNIRVVTSSRDLRIVALALFVTQFSLFIVEPILPLFIVSLHTAGSSATMVGLVFSVTGFSTMMFVTYWGRKGDRRGHQDVLFQALLFAGIAYFPQALATSVYHLLPLRAVIGFFVAGIVPSTQSLIVNNTDDSRRGGVLGITHAVSLFGQALGPLIGGGLGAAFGFRAPFILTSLLLIITSCLFRSYSAKPNQKGVR